MSDRWRTAALKGPGALSTEEAFLASGSQQVRLLECSRGFVIANVFVAREPWPHPLVEGQVDWRWHISVRILQPAPRVPSWNELTSLAHQLRPGVGFVVGIPPRRLWMNVHPDVLHLVEVKDPGIWQEWALNARGDSPT